MNLPSLPYGADRQAALEASATEKYQSLARSNWARIDRLFAVLMGLQWLFGIVLAITVSPWTWDGATASVHQHVLMAAVGGGILASLPIALAIKMPGCISTRMVIACSQLLFSSLLIHLSGGRIETHFHVFGSLAFLAAYRDWRVLVPATLIVAVDHFVRGIWWPESVFGVATASNWRWLEHAAWVVFEDIFLLITIRKSVCEVQQLASHTAQLEVAADAAQESERRTRLTVDAALDAVITIDQQGILTGWNPEAERIFGWSAGEAIGQPMAELIIPPDQRQAHYRGMERFRTEGKSSVLNKRLEFSAIRRNGEEFPVELTISPPLKIGEEVLFSAFVRDITEQKLAEQDRTQLAKIVQTSDDAIISYTLDGTITSWNKGAERLYGYSSAEMINQSLFRLVPAYRHDEVRKLLEEMEQGKSFDHWEKVNVRKDGTLIEVSLTISPLYDSRDNPIGFSAISRDITESKQFERKLHTAKEEAEAANRAKSQFLANMSHEIRTPLNGILGFAEVLLRDFEVLPHAERQEYLHTIRGSGKHLLGLINDILDLSKIEAGQLQIEKIECSPHQVIAETVSTLRVRAKEKGIGLDYRWDSLIPETVVSDPYRLTQLLINLTGNAIKFTEQGSVVIVARLEQQRNEAELILEVRDTGVGIPAEKLPTIFDPFVQADNSVTRKYGGTGLGLSICRSIAEELQGTLTVASELGAGSVFTLRIPVGEYGQIRLLEQPPQHAGADLKQQDMSDDDLDGARILVVDDGDTNRKLFGLILERYGAKVRLAENGKVALEMAGEIAFDLILMDMQMPVLDGYTATRKLRDRGYAGPIIALTAHAMKGDRQKCEESGCTGYLSKPVDTNELVNTVCSYLPSLQRSHEARENSSQQTQANSREPIRSQLPVEDVEFRQIIEEFVEKLPAQLEAMQEAVREEDLERVAELAHWLKGAGGTVGFQCFTEPAEQLQKTARDGNIYQATEYVDTLDKLRQRIVL